MTKPNQISNLLVLSKFNLKPMEKILIIGALLSALVVIIWIIIPRKKSSPQKTVETFDETTFIGRARKLFHSNEISDDSTFWKLIGIPSDVVDKLDSALISEYLSNKGLDKKTIQLIEDYGTEISSRHRFATEKLFQINPAKYNLIPKENEVVYRRIHNVTLLAEKTVRSTIQYSGSRISTGILRMGSLTYTSNISKDFVPQDIGMLFLSDKRIIFVGHQKNISKSFNISNLLSVKPFKDGILLMFSNRSPILLQFKIGEQKGNNGTYIEDGLNVFVIVLSRIIEGTADRDI